MSTINFAICICYLNFTKHHRKLVIIVTGAHCSVKPLSKLVTSILKILCKKYLAYDSKSFYFSDVKILASPK